MASLDLAIDTIIDIISYALGWETPIAHAYKNVVIFAFRYFLAFFAAATRTGKLFCMTVTELEPEIPLL